MFDSYSSQLKIKIESSRLAKKVLHADNWKSYKENELGASGCEKHRTDLIVGIIMYICVRYLEEADNCALAILPSS